MRYALLMDLIKGRNERRRIAMVTNLANGAERLVDYDRPKDDLLADDLEQAFRFDRSGIVKIGDAEYFINVYNPPLHLVIVGAVHLAQALIPLARAAGYDVTVIGPGPPLPRPNASRMWWCMMNGPTRSCPNSISDRAPRWWR